MILLIDIGNTRLKWAEFSGGLLTGAQSAIRERALPDEVKAAWQRMAAPARVVAANVAGDEYAQSISNWVEAHWGLSVEYVSVIQGKFGVELAYSRPTYFGVDRWLALIAARQEYSGPLCVVDCGTAVTIDALSAEGKHLGGAILPGMQLMQHSLSRQAIGVQHGIRVEEYETQSSILGTDTLSGLEMGSRYAVAGAVLHSLAKVEAVVGPATCVITGGDAAMVMAELGSAERWHCIPDLVLRGLKIVAVSD